jgi:hypothetical protein
MKKLLLTTLLMLSLPTFAGSQNNAKAKYSPQQISKFAKQVEHYAARQGARAFIIGRMGRPKEDLPKGIKYTHTAIAVYSKITLNSGKKVKGYVIHNLYQRNNQPSKSDLVQDYPVDFFWGAQQLTAGISIPTAKVQQRIIEAINNNVPKKVHNANYSVIANPMNQTFQNCTEHTLLVVNSAIYQTTDLNRLYTNNNNYFEPQKVRISPFKLMLGSSFVEGVSTKDHNSTVKTATFTSIAKYLDKYDLLYKSVSLDASGKVTDTI